MSKYFNALSAVLKDWKKAVPVIILTVARIIYGWSWFHAGIEKIAWLHDGKLNSVGKIGTMVENLAGSEVTRFDPLKINIAFAWIADTFFAGMPAITDILVVVLEFGLGLLILVGFKVFISALIALFLNLQFIAGGTFSNFGYIWTNLVLMKFAKYADVIGLDGFLRFKKGKELL